MRLDQEGWKGIFVQKWSAIIYLKKRWSWHRLPPNNEVFLYHLELLQILKKAIADDRIYAYHFALLRQILENIASFLGVGQFAYVLKQIGLTDTDEIARIVNTLSHKTVFRYEVKELVPDNKELFKNIFDGIITKYNFVLHA